MMKVKSTDT